MDIRMILIIAILIFPIFPFFTVITMAMLLSTGKISNSKLYYLFFFFLALYLGLINSTKVPESDLENYIFHFESVKFYSFFEYVFKSGKEPVYFAYTFISFYLLNGNSTLFIILTTAIAYFLLFKGIYEYLSYNNFSNNAIITALIISAFFPQLFSLSAHLIRQFLAGALMLNAIVIKSTKNKISWAFILSALFTHTSSAIMLLSFLPFLKRKISFILILILSVLSFSMLQILPQIGNFFLKYISVDFISYGFNRIANEIRDSASSYLSFLPLLTMLALMFIVINQLYIRKKFNQSIVILGNSYLFLFIFILGVYENTLLSSRLFVYVYMFFPFIILWPNFLQKRILTNLISLFFLVYFGFYLSSPSTWEYAPIEMLLINPIIYFL